ncbi:MAG: hypothetical protein ACQESG_02900 [Nanobdellota archaeon]
MIRYLRRLSSKRHQPDVEKACNNITQDLDILRQWVLHISSRNENMHSHHSSNLEVTRRDVQKLYRGIEHVYSDVQKLKNAMQETGKYLRETHQSHKDIYARIAALERTSQGQQRTSQGHPRTNQEHDEGALEGQPEDTQPQIRTPQRAAIAPPKIQIKDKSALNPSQDELMEVLFRATEPLDYKRIAAALGKKEKSIRNMIYEMREKGADIKDKNIGFRKKGFYITEETKMQISGR